MSLDPDILNRIVALKDSGLSLEQVGHVGYAHHGDIPDGLRIVDLPAVTAVCGVHLGPMSRISESWPGVHRWLVENNYDYAGSCRELYVRAESKDQQDWVTELQQPVQRR